MISPTKRHSDLAEVLDHDARMVLVAIARHRGVTGETPHLTWIAERVGIKFDRVKGILHDMKKLGLISGSLAQDRGYRPTEDGMIVSGLCEQRLIRDSIVVAISGGQVVAAWLPSEGMTLDVRYYPLSGDPVLAEELNETPDKFLQRKVKLKDPAGFPNWVDGGGRVCRRSLFATVRGNLEPHAPPSAPHYWTMGFPYDDLMSRSKKAIPVTVRLGLESVDDNAVNNPEHDATVEPGDSWQIWNQTAGPLNVESKDTR